MNPLLFSSWRICRQSIINKNCPPLTNNFPSTSTTISNKDDGEINKMRGTSPPTQSLWGSLLLSDYWQLSTAGQLLSRIFTGSSPWWHLPAIDPVKHGSIKVNNIKSSANMSIGNENEDVVVVKRPYRKKSVMDRGEQESAVGNASFDEMNQSCHSPSLDSLTAAEKQMQFYPLRRVNSNDWVRSYKKERIDKINFNNVFGGVADISSNNEIPKLPLPNEDISQQNQYSGLSIYSRIIGISSPSSSVMGSPTSSTTSAEDSQSSPLLLPIASMSMNQPTANDVICGRGGRANSHPGNVSFRSEALKLRSWYESSSKSEKFTISSMLVDFVRERGGRFLKRDPANPGHWLEADSNDVRRKASQALREGKLKASSDG